jgi:flagella basal body P-ring formation protein FlgA
MSIAPFIAFAAPLSFSVGVAAQTPTVGGVIDPVEIDRAVATFTGKTAGEVGGAATLVDSRLRLASCGSPLSLDWYGSAGRTVSVACPGKGGWQIYVNLRQAPRAQAAAPAIRRGEAVTIAFRGRGFTVQQQGEARSSGAVGEWIEVRTDRRSPTLRARVERPGLVVIDNG